MNIYCSSVGTMIGIAKEKCKVLSYKNNFKLLYASILHIYHILIYYNN